MSEVPEEQPPATVPEPPRQMTPEEVRAWGEGLLERRAWVLHRRLLAVGPVRSFYDGADSRYLSPVNGVEVTAPVLELETGHALVADPDNFVELSDADFRFYAAMQQGLVGLIALAARGAHKQGVDAERGMVLVLAALRAQVAALETKGTTK